MIPSRCCVLSLKSLSSGAQRLPFDRLPIARLSGVRELLSAFSLECVIAPSSVSTGNR